MIYEQRTCLDDAGRSILSRQGVTATHPSFFANGVLQFELNGAPASFNFHCDIPGSTPEEAFANFAAAFDQAKQRAEAELNLKLSQAAAEARRQIVLPGGAAPLPQGRPITRFR